MSEILMKNLFYLISCCFTISCNSNNNTSIKQTLDHDARIIEDTIQLPGIVSYKTVYFHNDDIYYQAMDMPGKESFKCFSLKHKQLIWSKNINQMGINMGVIASTGEYVVPTLSDSVYLIDTNGKARILKLEDRCKINPLIYKNNIILQDRGIGLKCFDTRTLQELWTIRQKQGGATMSHPFLVDSNIIYILDDMHLQSANAGNGMVNWSVSVNDSLNIQLLYGLYSNLVFVLSTDLKQTHFITAFDVATGNKIWKEKVDSSIEVWETSMIVTDEKLFCRGDHSIFVYDIKNGANLKNYEYKVRLGTNLVADKNGNIFFGLDNNMLMKIDRNGKDSPIIFNEKINYLYSHKGTIFLYSYPKLYSLKAF
ncbi:MAG: PQQ-like beta-propeller repeat protein [Chitinophagaceae bacterium]|nr:PQQ-like beta-propeller repeat protein [Chitinophagaceae bacterium]